MAVEFPEMLCKGLGDCCLVAENMFSNSKAADVVKASSPVRHLVEEMGVGVSS